MCNRRRIQYQASTRRRCIDSTQSAFHNHSLSLLLPASWPTAISATLVLPQSNGVVALGVEGCGVQTSVCFARFSLKPGIVVPSLLFCHAKAQTSAFFDRILTLLLRSTTICLEREISRVKVPRLVVCGGRGGREGVRKRESTLATESFTGGQSAGAPCVYKRQ